MANASRTSWRTTAPSELPDVRLMQI